MAFFFIIDYIVSFFILRANDAPRWAWYVYAGSALFWFVIWALSGSGTVGNMSNNPQKDSTCTED